MVKNCSIQVSITKNKIYNISTLPGKFFMPISNKCHSSSQPLLLTDLELPIMTSVLNDLELHVREAHTLYAFVSGFWQWLIFFLRFIYAILELVAFIFICLIPEKYFIDGHLVLLNFTDSWNSGSKSWTSTIVQCGI